MTANDLPKDAIRVPQLCSRCLHELVVVELEIKESSPWKAAIVVANILLFQQASNEPSIWRRAEQQVENLSLILAEIGCLGCAFDRKPWERVVRIMKRGISHASKVSRGEIADPDHPNLAKPA